MTSLMDELEREIALGIERLHEHPRASRVLDGTATADELSHYYASAHEAVRHAGELLAQSGRRLREEGAKAEICELMLTKSQQEGDHHYWLRNDAEAIGLPIGHASSPKPAPAAYAYVDFHRKVIPLSGYGFLGTALVLETFAQRCAGQAADNLRKRSEIRGISQGSLAGVSFLHHHHEEDVAHVAQLHALLDRYVVDSTARAYLLLCARFTATVYADFF